jgi:hypothetical protein
MHCFSRVRLLERHIGGQKKGGLTVIEILQPRYGAQQSADILVIFEIFR